MRKAEEMQQQETGRFIVVKLCCDKRAGSILQSVIFDDLRSTMKYLAEDLCLAETSLIGKRALRTSSRINIEHGRMSVCIYMPKKLDCDDIQRVTEAVADGMRRFCARWSVYGCVLSHNVACYSNDHEAKAV